MAEKHRTVDEFLAAQDPARREQVEGLRDLVREADPRLVEIVKWNSPNYTIDGADRLTVNAAGRGPVRLILHLGTARAEHAGAPSSFDGDPSGLLRWHSDIRGSLAAPPAEDSAARAAVVDVVRAWLAFEPAE